MSEKVIYEIGLKDGLSAGLVRATGNAKGLDSAMGGLNNGFKKTPGVVNGVTSSLKRMIGPLLAIGAAYKAIRVASESITEAREFESLENAITFAAGSAEEGAKSLQFIADTSSTLGLDLKSTTEGFKTFSGSMLGTALAGDASKKIFAQVSMAASSMGLTAEQTKGTFIALGQIMGKGKVQAEELRGQLGERIPGAFNIAARAMGVTTAELDKMMADGKLVAEDFLPKFGEELQKTFGPGLEKSVKSSAAQFNRFNNNILKLKLSFGRAVMPTVNKFFDKFSKGIQIFKSLRPVIEGYVLAPLRSVWETIKPLGLAIGNIFAKIFGLDTSNLQNFITSALKSIRQLLLGVQFIVNPIIKAVTTVFEAFSTMFSGVEKESGRVLHGKLIADMVYWSTFFSETLKAVTLVAQGEIAKGGGTLRGAMQKAKKQELDYLFKVEHPELFNLKGEYAPFAKSATAGEEVKKALNALKGKGGSALEEYNKMLGSLGGAGAAGSAGSTAGGKKASTTVDDIKSGRPTHINIDIGKLVETMNITSMGIDDLTGQVKDAVAKVLVSAVSNVNNIAK